VVWCWFNAPNAIETGRALCGARSSKLTPMRGHLTAGKYVDGLHGRALRRHWRTRGGAADAADGRGRRRRGHVCRGAQRLLVALLVDIRVTDMLGMEPRCIAGTPANPAKMPTALLRGQNRDDICRSAQYRRQRVRLGPGRIPAAVSCNRECPRYAQQECL